MIRLAVLVALASGCATFVDLAHHYAGPRGREAHVGAGFATTSVHAREVAADPFYGLVCRDVETPHISSAHVETRVTDPNGYRLPMQVFTGLEATITGIYVAAHEASCAKDGCANRNQYLYMLPLFADIAWGLYRSFTIHNTIVRESVVTWPGRIAPTDAMGLDSGCPIGTELALYAGEERVTVHVGEQGRLAAADLDVALRFVLDHPGFSVGDVRFDASRIAGLVALARSKLEPPVVATRPEGVAPPPPAAPPVVVPAGLCVEHPLAQVCVRARPPRPRR